MDESDAQKKRAADDISIIRELKEYGPFKGYFLRRLRENIDARKRRVMSTQTTPEATTIEKHIIEALESDVLKLLDKDEAGCRSILSQ